MKWLFSKNMVLLVITAAVLIFAIRFFETGFHAGEISTKVYITIIGIIFLAVGAFTAAQMTRRKTVIQYVEKEKEITKGKESAEVNVAANNLLTDRECDILKGIARGLTNKQIGEELFVSENTVKKHVNNIYFKLDVNRRTQAIAKAKALKILAE